MKRTTGDRNLDVEGEKKRSQQRRSSPRATIRPAKPRETAQVRFSDGRLLEGPVGTPLEEFIHALTWPASDPVVAALVDGVLRELTFPVVEDVDVMPITMSTFDGMRIYRRSLSFLLVTAVHELFPEAQVFVDHSVPFGGFYCHVEGREPFSAEELKALEAHMRRIVEEDAPITPKRMSLDEAMAFFQAQGEDALVRLLAQRRKESLTVYQLHDLCDCFHGYMVPSTGYLRYFALQPYPPGFILRFPLRSTPTVLQPARDYPLMAAVFREYREWEQVIGLEDVGALDAAIQQGRMNEVILIAEALHEQRISVIAQELAERKGEIRLVLIAGPSASGKTTFTKRLAVQLLANGVRPVAISLDDFFVDRERTPRDKDGNPDFEALNALDLELFNTTLLRLMEGQRVTLPHYDFRTGTRQPGETLSITPDHLILVEGIHGLNPDLVPSIPPDCTFRIYVSALTHLNLDRHNRVSTSDTRLIRRIVRDAATRGYTAQQTIAAWERVRNGEEKYIFPYQEHADVMFNSALVYELAVLKSFAEPLLLQIPPGTVERVEAERLLAFLDWFHPYPPDTIPSNSILREFIGGSILRDFRPWFQENEASSHTDA